MKSKKSLPNSKLSATYLKQATKCIAFFLILSVVIGIAVALAACNVTRTVTTTSQVVQRGDTTTTITSRTIEAYDASKRY